MKKYRIMITIGQIDEDTNDFVDGIPQLEHRLTFRAENWNKTVEKASEF